MRQKILTVVGARPQFIKAAVVSRALASCGAFEEQLLHTGQHYDDCMSRRFFEELQIPEPTWNLGVGSGPHGMQTGRMLEGIERVIRDWQPDRVLVYGDTNSTLAGALAATKMHCPCAHVEAGLRSYDRRMPEEVNRVVADVLSDLLFCPTATTVRNLAREGRTETSGVRLVGDVMYDAVRIFSASATRLPDAVAGVAVPFALMTCHRAENTDDPVRLGELLDGASRVARLLPVVFPIHPRTAAAMKSFGLSLPDGILGIPPISYLETLALLGRAAVVMTDSGGLQKEAFFAHVPCVTLRDRTEWVELVEAGWNSLVGTSPEAIVQAVERAISSAPPDHREDLFGDGHAAEKIAGILASEPVEGLFYGQSD